MTPPFERFEDRLHAASDEHARRNLLAELGMWRAQNLADIPAMRDAAFAMARLYQSLGQNEPAVREARSLLSLCRTSPEASGEETRHAESLLESLGVKRSPSLSPTPRRGGSAPRSASPSPDRAAKGDRAVRAAGTGDWDGLLGALRGRKGPKADVLRTYAHLQKLQNIDDPAALRREISSLAERLRQRLQLPRPAPGAAQPRAVAEPLPPTAQERRLIELLGADRLPSKRDAMMQVLEAFANEHPEQIDELAAAALAQHVAAKGLRAPAPWLVGFVARALAGGPGRQTRAELERLHRQEAFAVSAYTEWPFTRAVEVLAESLRLGWDFIAFRRGVLSRGEPGSRKAWTLRLSSNFTERMLVVAPLATQDYREGLVERLVQRMLTLCPRVVLIAPGAGNAGLREAASAAGIRAMEDDANAAVLEALEACDPVTLPQREAPVAPVSAPSAPKPLDTLRDVLTAEEAPSFEQVVAAVRELKRTFRAFQVAEAVGSQPDRLALLLRAAHEVEAPGRRLNEGTTWVIRSLATSADGPMTTLLEDEAVRARYGGPGLGLVTQVVRVCLAWGMSLDRVLRGPTRRNCKDNPAIEAFADSLRPLWRLVFKDAGETREVWVAEALATEGRAGLPLMLLVQRPQAFVVSSEEAAALQLEGIDPIPWNEGGAPSLTAALDQSGT